MIVLFSSILLGFSLLVVSATVPKERMIDNIVKSSIYLKDSPQIRSSLRLKRDNYTEAIMCAMVGNVDDTQPAESVMKNAYYRLGKPEASFYHHYKHGTKGMREILYYRYWHGYLVVLRPLFAIMDYQGIRYFNYVVFSLVTLVLLYMANKQYHLSILIPLIVALLYASVHFIPQCIQFSTTFYIAMISCILIMAFPWLQGNIIRLSCMFVCIGACTSYADLLVTPMVTLGFPLVFVLLQMLEKKSTSCQFKAACKLSAAWFFGYAGMWVAKWVIYALFFAQGSVVESLSDKITERSIGGVPSYCTFERFFADSIWFIPNVKNTWWSPTVISFITLVINVLICLFISRPEASKKYSVLLAIAAIPFAWLALAYNHTLVHIWFTHRMWSVSVFAILIFVVKVIYCPHKNQEQIQK